MPDPRETPAEGEVVLAWTADAVLIAEHDALGWWAVRRDDDPLLDGTFYRCAAPDVWVPLPLARRAREMEAALAKIRGYGCSAYVFDDQPPAACECPGCLAARALMLPPANPEEPE